MSHTEVRLLISKKLLEKMANGYIPIVKLRIHRKHLLVEEEIAQ